VCVVRVQAAAPCGSFARRSSPESETCQDCFL
jgi:hypothetical protein